MVTSINPGLPPITLSTKVLDARLQKFADSKGYVAQANGISPAVGGQFIIMRIVNPAASGKTMTITALIFGALTNNTFFVGNPVTPLQAAFATTSTPKAKLAGQAAAQGIFSRDNTQGASANLGGGAHRVIANDSKLVPVLIILPPNSSIDVGPLNTTVGDTVDVSAEWFEE